MWENIHESLKKFFKEGHFPTGILPTTDPRTLHQKTEDQYFKPNKYKKLGKSFQELIKLTAILNIFLSLSNHLTLKLGLKFMPALFHSSLSYHLCIKPIHTWSIKIQFVLTIFEALSLKQTNCLEARWVHFCLSSYKTQIEMCNNTQYKIWNSIVSNDQKCLK